MVATLLGQWKALSTTVVGATAAAFAVVLVSAGLGRLCLLSSVFCLLPTDYWLLLQSLKRSSNALRDVVCRAEPVSRSTVARALKSGQAVKAPFGVTRAVIGCMHS